MEHESESSQLRDFLTVLFKNKFKIVSIFLLMVISVGAYSFLTPPVYEASSSLMIRFGREYVYRPEVGGAANQLPMQSFSSPDAIISSEIQVFTSIDLIEKAINSLGVENLYPQLAQNSLKALTPLQAATLKFQKNLTVENIKGSNVIKASFRHTDPQIASQAINLLVDFFQEKHLQVFNKPKSSFLEEKLKTYRQKLEESENNLESYKQQYGVYSLDEQRSLLLQQQMELDSSLKATSNQVVELRKKHSFLDNQLNGLSDNTLLYTETERFKIVDDAKSQLLALQLEEQALLKKFKPKNPLIANIRKEIAIVENFLKDQELAPKEKARMGKNTIHQEVKMAIIRTRADLQSTEAKRTHLQQQLDHLNQELQALDLAEKELRKLTRNLETDEKNYMSYLNKVEEARISDEMDRQKLANLSIIQTAKPPAKPILPRKGLNIAVGIILGAVTSIGFALFSEFYLNQSVSTPERAERLLDLPVLTTVPLKSR